MLQQALIRCVKRWRKSYLSAWPNKWDVSRELLSFVAAVTNNSHKCWLLMWLYQQIPSVYVTQNLLPVLTLLIWKPVNMVAKLNREMFPSLSFRIVTVESETLFVILWLNPVRPEDRLWFSQLLEEAPSVSLLGFLCTAVSEGEYNS